MQAAVEPPLRLIGEDPNEVYRFWVLGNHRNPLCHVIRLECIREKYRLIGKDCHPANKDIGPWTVRADRSLMRGEFQDIARLCAEQSFWRQPPHEHEREIGRYSVWQIVEAMSHGQYHEVTRYVLPPQLNAAFRLAEKLAGFAESEL